MGQTLVFITEHSGENSRWFSGPPDWLTLILLLIGKDGSWRNGGFSMFTGMSLEEVTYEPLDIPNDFFDRFESATSIITTVLYCSKERYL